MNTKAWSIECWLILSVNPEFRLQFSSTQAIGIACIDHYQRSRASIVREASSFSAQQRLFSLASYLKIRCLQLRARNYCQRKIRLVAIDNFST
ncbi:hypothetical protein Q3G72_024434 [Acer saccharum]|nr:hypothetical protein Q3G72_024434 [Acer saccharum]